ncbi:MAG TPA: rhomboid family intramembrane serine protease [Luteibaculaceae bacterium]|nr:rhomboid family intramembrane serine protease [Luteibaculaceae bacterium]
MFIQRGFNSNTVIGNLIIINVLAFVAKWLMGYADMLVCGEFEFGAFYRTISKLDLIAGLFLPLSENFRPWQIVTHMFMHGDFFHLLFNMYALWMFGSTLEQVWGARKFLIFYFVCGLGAALTYTLVRMYELQGADEAVACVANAIPVLGASGAVFGVLLGFGMLFPNTELMLLFFPIPIKAKYFVLGYGAIELYTGLKHTPGDNVAHFAHLGGMIFAFILIKVWSNNRNTFY